MKLTVNNISASNPFQQDGFWSSNDNYHFCKEKELDAICQKLDRIAGRYSLLKGVKSALECNSLDPAILVLLNQEEELSDLTNLPLDYASANWSFSLKNEYCSKLEHDMEGLLADIKNLLASIINAFVEFWKSWMVANRRYRFQLQTHLARLRSDIRRYCEGDQQLFGSITINTYHYLIWRQMLNACKEIIGTYADLNSGADSYLQKNGGILSTNFAVFGQSLTNEMVITNGTAPERRDYTLSGAQWRLNDLQNNCEWTIQLLRDDQEMDRVMNNTIRTMRQAIQNVNTDVDVQLKKVKLIRSILKTSSRNLGGTARALIYICIAARDFKR